MPEIDNIYPQVNLNSTDGLSVPDQVLPPSSTEPSIYSLLLSYFVGLFGIGLLGLFYGATFNLRLVSLMGHDFGLIVDKINLLHFVPLATVLFGALAYIRKNLLFLFYPFVAFYIAGTLLNADITRLIAGYIPVEQPTNNPDYLTCLVAVTLAYTLIQAYTWPIWCTFQAITADDIHKKVLVVSLALTSITTMFCCLAWYYSKPLLVAQVRSRTAVHIPFGTGQIGTPPQLDYTLYQKDGKLSAAAGDITVHPVMKWWETNVHSVCGDRTLTNVRPGQTPANSYATTSGGVQYATAIFDANAAQPAVPTAAYKEYRYCFVLGYQRYTLIRNDRDDNAARLQIFPSTELIDTIAKAQTYIPGCPTKKLSYCKPEDTGKAQKLDSNIYRPTVSLNSVTGVTTPTANKNAYRQIGELSVSEWGIRFPLSSDIADAYYTPKTSDMFVIKLHNLDSLSCFNQDGVAYLGRTPLPDAPLGQNQTINGRIVGNYVYSLYGNASLNFCANRGAIDNSQASKLSDVFDWAAANIH